MARKVASTIPAIQPHTFFDLGMWLSSHQAATSEQIARIKCEDDYIALIALANQYWLTALLCHKLQRHPVWTDLPIELTSYLLEIESVYAQRAADIKAEVIDITKILKQAKITPLLFKGSASLFNGVTTPNSTRYMSDIDLLIDEPQLAMSQAVLAEHGYQADLALSVLDQCPHHHLPPMLKADSLSYVELHRAPLKLSISRILNADEAWRNKQPITLTEHVSAYQLSPTQQVIVAIAHSELSNDNHAEKHLDLRQLVSLQEIICCYHDHIDWQQVKSHFSRANKLPILLDTLYSLATLLGLTTPITEKQLIASQHHFDACLERYFEPRIHKQVYYSVRRILHSYAEDEVLSTYGKKGRLPLLRARLKHLQRHMGMLATPEYFRRFIRRNFTK